MAEKSTEMQVTWEKYAQGLASSTTQWIMGNLDDPKHGIKVPKGYDVGNEIESAMFMIVNNVKNISNVPAIQCCTKDSIMMALRDMALQGLSVAKKQAYFIVYGNQLQLQRSYFGTITALRYMFPRFRITANVIYQGDKYVYCTDPEGDYNYIRDVESSLENRDKPIVAAYGSIYDETTGKRVYGCVMTMQEIQANWNKSRSKDRGTQKEFPQEMAKRTLINRMCKLYINSSVGIEADTVAAFNRATENEYDDGNLQNVTPPETNAERQELLRGRSQGTAGLSALLSDRATGAQNASEEADGVIIPPVPSPSNLEAEKRPEKEAGKPAASNIRPSVRLDEWGNAVPNDEPAPDAGMATGGEPSLFDDDRIPF